MERVNLTPTMSMTKTQVYLAEDDLAALHELSERTGKSLAELIREAIRTVWLRPSPSELGPVSIWNGPIRRTSSEHDSIYDEP
jgi:hypothetical protein